MKVLITGSKGLIGSALDRALQRFGFQVAGIDLRDEVGTARQGNILDHDLIKEKMSDCQGVIHLAAISRVIMGEKNPALCWQTNVQGTSHIVNCALKSDPKPWVIYASSREVYGQQQTLPVKESDPLSPVNIYGESKVEAEKIILAARKQGLSSAILRFSNVYGSVHDYRDRVIPAFCISAIKQTEMRIDGADQLFDFTYIDDVISGIISTISLLSQNPSAELPPMHLTTGIPSSLGQVAAIANQVGGNRAKMREAPCRSYDVARFFGDPGLARKILKWRACIGVEDGIQRLINDYKLFFQGAGNEEFSQLLYSC